MEQKGGEDAVSSSGCRFEILLPFRLNNATSHRKATVYPFAKCRVSPR